MVRITCMYGVMNIWFMVVLWRRGLRSHFCTKTQSDVSIDPKERRVAIEVKKRRKLTAAGWSATVSQGSLSLAQVCKLDSLPPDQSPLLLIPGFFACGQ